MNWSETELVLATQFLLLHRRMPLLVGTFDYIKLTLIIQGSSKKKKEEWRGKSKISWEVLTWGLDEYFFALSCYNTGDKVSDHL